MYSNRRKNARPNCSHVFQATGTILELVQDIIRTNVQTKFHEDWTINVTLRVLTSFYYSHSHKAAFFFNQPEPFWNSSKILLRQIF